MTTDVCLVGCGAVAEFYYAGALGALVASGHVALRALVDPDARRRATLGRIFPAAQRLEKLEDLTPRAGDLAILASPPRFHAAQATWLLERGFHVLCEKPLAASSAEAGRIVQAATDAQRVLGVALVRRFYPALQTIRQFCSERHFGPLRSFDIQEGGPFNWPAATPSFFDQRQAGGGVLLDAGVHVLDVLLWWLGEPDRLKYCDDAMGGLEANCRIELGYDGAEVDGTVLLSRDWRTANRWRLQFERADVVWRVGEANKIEIRPRGSERWLVSTLETDVPVGRVPADTHAQAFTRQILDVLESARESRSPRVTGEEGLRGLRLIDRCYGARQPMTPLAP